MLTTKQINAKTLSIKKSSAKLRDAIQEVAVSIIGHAFEHGDVTLADNLLDACGKSVDRQALVAYLEDHGPFMWSKKEMKFALNKTFRKENVYDEAYLTKDAPKWYDYGRELTNIITSVDIDGKVTSVIKLFDALQSGEKKAKNGETMTAKEGSFDAQLINELRQCVASFHLRKAA